MPKIRIPGFRKSPRSDDENIDEPELRTDRGSFSRGGSVSFNRVSIANGNGSKALASLMSANKNPSTVFTPPFGTNVEEHHSKLGEHAQNLWQYNKITDLTVKLQGVQYACHKTVLSCYSKYFKELLLDQKGTVNVIYLRLPSVSNAAFEVLLEYMYTSKLNLTCQNIGEVYTASRKLGIDGALVLCTKILTGQTKHGVHAVYLYVTAKKQHMRDCAAKAMKIMTRRFEQIVGTPEFLDLDFPQVMEYLSQDVLATRSEVIVFLAALKWLSVKYLEREQHAVDLIGCVRFQMMTLNEILACFSPPLLPGILEHKMIKDKLLLATCYVAATTVNEEKRFENYACRPRKYLLQREPIILWDPSIFDPDRHAMYQEEMAATTIQAAYRGYKTRKSVESDRAAGLLQPSERYLEDFTEFVPPKDEDDETIIHKIGSKSDSRTRQSVLENIRKSIVSFMSGGEEEKDDKASSARNNEDSSVRHAASVSRSSSVDALANHINNLTENTEIKKYTSDTVFDMNSHEFTKNFSNEHDTVHKIYTKTNKEGWPQEDDVMQSISSTSDENQFSSDLVKGSITVTGGFGSDDTQDKTEGKMMFTFDSVKNKWKVYATMGKARHHHCLVYFNEELYFIGGCDPEKTKSGRMIPGKNCYKFNLQSRKWSKISKMKHSRMYHGAVELDGKIYVVGGKDHTDSMLDSIEVYNPASNKWEDFQPSLDTPTMGLGLCVHQGNLWIIGGMIQEKSGNVRLLKDVKYYDAEKRRWINNHASIPFPRAFSTAVSFENSVYIIGGTSQENGAEEDQLTSVNDVMYYDNKEKKWMYATNLPFPRHFVQAAVIGNGLYVLGGLSSYQKTAADEVIVYERKARKWRACAPMPEILCGFAAASV